MESASQLKENVARNVSTLRQKKGITQGELGEMLNYSDKSVSKWERGEGMPDVYVLKNMAEIFGVSVDYLLTAHDGEEEIYTEGDQNESAAVSDALPRINYKVIMLIALAGIWAIDFMVFAILWMGGTLLWQIFAYALPVSALTVLVLNSVWNRGKGNVYTVSALIWSILLSIFVSISGCYYQIFLIGIPAEIIVVLSFCIKRK